VGAGASTGAVAGGGGGESETWGGCARATVGGCLAREGRESAWLTVRMGAFIIVK
jgi:hypothetical protein